MIDSISFLEVQYVISCFVLYRYTVWKAGKNTVFMWTITPLAQVGQADCIKKGKATFQQP